MSGDAFDPGLAERVEAVHECNADVDFGGLAVGVSRCGPLAKGFETAHLRLDPTSDVIARPPLPNSPTKGDGLASQESRCREYARYKGYEVIEVFNDNKSGGDADRPAMIALLAYLKVQKETCVVIIDDISRFARDVVGH